MRICNVMLMTMAVMCSAVPSSQAHEPAVIASGHGPLAPKQPQAAIGANGHVHLVFGIRDTVQYAGAKNGNIFEKSNWLAIEAKVIVP